MNALIPKILLICYLSIGFSPAPAKSFHPLHLSSTDLVYNTKGGTVEISCRLFTDDLENALSKQFGVAADLSAPAKHQAMDVLLKKYIALHFKLQANGKALPLQYLGFEKDREAVMIYVESAQVKGLKKLAVVNSLMYDLFDDQTNLMHVTYNGERKSAKLDYPETNATLLNR